jgi:hypothetical protein
MTLILCLIAIIGWLAVFSLLAVLSVVSIAYGESQVELKTLQKSLEIAQNSKLRTKVWNTNPRTETSQSD